jgi:hypothetical protein
MSDQAVVRTGGGAPRLGPGLLAGGGAALLGAVVLGPLQGSFGYRALEVGYWALALGILTGFALGRVGGRARTVALFGVPLALLGVLLAQLIAATVYVGDADLGDALHFWRTQILGKNDLAFYAVAATEGYLVAKRAAETAG